MYLSEWNLRRGMLEVRTDVGTVISLLLSARAHLRQNEAVHADAKVAEAIAILREVSKQ